MAERAEELNQTLPISISIGVDPAIEIGSCFEPPTTPLGYDELSAAGAIRKEPVQLCKCVSIKEMAIANAEYVIEGEVIPHVRVKEDQNSHTGYAMPEFPGYTGPASEECWLIKVKAVTHRKNPIMQTCIGPSESMCQWQESLQRQAFMEWWKRQCQEDFKMYTVVQLVVENIWLCSNSKSCLQVTREAAAGCSAGIFCI